jgi:hypothetical protein
MEYKWILFCPQLPATPSSPRVMIWRKMRTAGSLGLDNGLWLLPYSERSLKIISEMKTYVSGQGGTSKTFLSNALDEETEAGILRKFGEDRAEEYAELKEQCADLLAELQKETERQNFSFAEYEENEQDLEKLEIWFGKVQERDFLGGEDGREASAWLDKCRLSLQLFADQVYEHEDPDHSHKMRFDPGLIEPKSE